jgi:hypothetical protein
MMGGDLWDDRGNGKGAFDMEDFADAAVKFRETMLRMKFTEEKNAAEEDPMEVLQREQEQRGRVIVKVAPAGDDMFGLLDGEDLAVAVEDDVEDDIPDWADDDDAAEILKKREQEQKGVTAAGEQAASSESKRSMLLQVAYFITMILQYITHCPFEHSL